MANPSPRTDHLERYQWEPGHSGNPAGRPPGRRLRDAINAQLQEKTRDGKTIADALAQVLVLGALQGKVQFLKLLLDRAWPPSLETALYGRLGSNSEEPTEKDREAVAERLDRLLAREYRRGQEEARTAPPRPPRQKSEERRH